MATILAVDDEPDVLEIVRLRLMRDGHTVLTSANGPAAISNAVNRQPDLILLDLMMPGMDGFEVIQELKASPHTVDIPVIFVTARGDYRAKAEAWERYASGYITKPFDLDALAETVRRVLAGERAPEEASL